MTDPTYAADPRRYWEERHAREGDAYVGSNRHADQQRTAFWAALEPHIEPVNTLDLGCGTGRFTDLIRPELGSAVYYGVDHNRRAINALQAAQPAARLYREIFSTTLPGPRTVRQLVAITVLQHVPDEHLGPLVTRLRSALVSRGRRVLLIEDANPEGAAPAPHMTFRTADDYAALFDLRLAHVETITAERPNSHYLAILEGR